MIRENINAAVVKTEVEERMRRALFDMETALRRADDSAFKWSKSRYEALEGIMMFIDPDFNVDSL